MKSGIQSHVNIQSAKLTDKIENSQNESNTSGQTSEPSPSDVTSEPSIINERIDDIPLLIAMLLKLDLPNAVDKYYTPHDNHQGLSHGWLLTIWIVYILSRGDHYMNRVEDWVATHRSSLRAISGQPVTAKDFTDDRLAKLLKILSNNDLWPKVEHHLSQHSIQAYNLPVEKVRLDATTASVNHDPDLHDLFKVGRTKQGTYEPQFKLMMGALDPLGLPLAVDVVPGDKADDPLYVPVYKRIHESLDQAGVLYIGDSKMAAIETRATIVRDENYYLMPLPMTGETPGLLDTLLSDLESGRYQIAHIFLPEDLSENLMGPPNPELALAKGFEIQIKRRAVLDEEEVVWMERVCCVRSFRYAASQSKGLDNRLAKAEQALQNLTPPPGRGKKQYQDEASLTEAADKILKRYNVEGLIHYTTERHESSKQVRAYKGNPARTEITVRYQIYTVRDTEEIEKSKQRLGWRLYAVKAPSHALSLSQVVLTYRDQYLVERDFSRLKGRRLGLTPLHVQRDDHACGLIRLLTIALRAMNIIEFRAHEKLSEEQALLRGIYPGNPKRGTATPSVDMMLNAFQGLDFYIVDLPNGQHFEQISNINNVQKKILHLLDLSE